MTFMACMAIPVAELKSLAHPDWLLGMVKDNAERLDRLAAHLREPQIPNVINLMKFQNNVRKG